MATGCTQGFSSATIKDKSGNLIAVYDTPGLNDPNLNLVEWVTRFKDPKQNMVGREVNLILIAFKCNVRPSNEQKQDFLTVIESIEKLQPENLGIVFTFSESDEKYQDPKLSLRWLNTLCEVLGNDLYKNIPSQKVFWFCGKDGSWAKPTGEVDEEGDPVTTPIPRKKTKGEELRDWIEQVCPKSSCKLNAEMKADNIISAGISSGDASLIEYLKVQVK